MKTILRYDGKYEGFPDSFDSRSWTILSHFIDANGADRYRGSFGLETLVQLGVIKASSKVEVA